MSDEQFIALEHRPEIPKLSFRHFRGESDYGSMAEVLTISQRADHYDRSVTAEDIAKAYANTLTNCDPYADIIMAEVAGRMVGYVRGWWEQESTSMHLYKHMGVLLPVWRRKGIGRAMLDWMENHLKAISETHPREFKKFFQVSVSKFQEGIATLLERAGYQSVRFFLEMVRSNLDDIPDFPLPDGLEIRPVTPDQYRVVWESAHEPDEEEWGLMETTENAYQEWLKDPLFQPYLWQIAWDKETGDPAGHVLTYIHYEENKQFKRKRGYTEGVGVSRAWRRRGLARALISRSLQAQKAAGMAESALVVDSDNGSGAAGLMKAAVFKLSNGIRFTASLYKQYAKINKRGCYCWAMHSFILFKPTQGGADAFYTIKSEEPERCRKFRLSYIGLLSNRMSPIHQTFHAHSSTGCRHQSFYTYSPGGPRYKSALPDSNPVYRFSLFRDMDWKFNEWNHRNSNNRHIPKILSGRRNLRDI